MHTAYIYDMSMCDKVKLMIYIYIYIYVHTHNLAIYTLNLATCLQAILSYIVDSRK